MIDPVAEFKNMKFPVILKQGLNGYYVVRCALFKGCISQGKTIDEALANIKEAIELCLEEEASQELAREYKNSQLYEVSM